MSPLHRVTIEKLVFGGQGLAHLPNGQVIFVWNTLPGEVVDARVIKQKKEYIEAVAETVIEASPERREPQDSHYLSSSPWQMMSYSAELQEKKNIAAETYSKIGDMILSPNDIEMVTDDNEYGYRNKMEFSFTDTEDGNISLAFFQRGKKFKIPATGSALAHAAINNTAQYILSWVNTHNIPIRSLKSLILRSNGTHVIAGLFIKDKLEFPDYPALTNELIGFTLIYSTHKCPASIITETLQTFGKTHQTEIILDTSLSYGLMSFFQINIPVFTLALKDIAAFLHPKEPLVDYYAGVGAIGLPLSRARTQTQLVESNTEAVDFAQKNIAANNMHNCHALATPAEKMTEYITKDTQVILDPPRAGLHQDVIKALLQTQPTRVIYLSCNISTQARDMRMLSSVYKPLFLKLYNFFPKTPHFEGLCVLEKQ